MVGDHNAFWKKRLAAAASRFAARKRRAKYWPVSMDFRGPGSHGLP
jgi:hypothetical protein